MDADFDDNPFDFLDDIGFQALDAMVSQAFAQEHEPDELDAPRRRDEDMPKACKQYREPAPNQRHNLGPMNVMCTHCNACHWKDEDCLILQLEVQNLVFVACKAKFNSLL